MTLPVRQNDSGLARLDPLTELNRVARELTRAFDPWPQWATEVAGFTPLADIEETEDAYLIEVELPGVKREDVSVELADQRLVIDGERKEKERTGVFRRRTRSVGRFHYEVTLGGAIDADKIDARLDDGVLTVRAPKSATSKGRRIPIE